MSKLLYKNFYIVILWILFIYLPIETIMHGISLNILPPSYFLILTSGFYASFIILANIKKYSLKILRYGRLSSVIIVLILLYTFIFYMIDELYYIPINKLIIYILFFISYSGIGIYLGIKIDDIQIFLQNKKKNIFYWFAFLMIVFYSLLLYSNSFDLSIILFGFGNKIEHSGIHLVTTGFIAVYGLWQIIESKKYALFYGVLVFITLFILGSRSALAFYLLVLIFLLYKVYGFKRYFYIIIVFFGFLFFYLDNILLLLEGQDRMYSLVTLNMDDGSLMEREEQLYNNWKLIQDNIFTGRIMGELLVGGPGSYIHSYLSYLQNYGIIIFVFINLLILKLFYLFFKNIKTQDHFFLFMGSSFIYVVLEFIFSRGYSSYHLFAFLIIFEVYFTSFIKNNSKIKGIYNEKN